VEQSESCVGIGGNLGRAQEVPAFERGVTMHVPIVRLRQDDIEQERGPPVRTAALAPEPEAHILLTIRAHEMSSQGRFDIRRHSEGMLARPLSAHCWAKRERTWRMYAATV